MAPLLALVAQTLQTFLQIYVVLLILRILLSWFPNVDWFSPPFSILSQLTDPYLNIFRSIIPPLGGIDFSAILAIFLLQFVGQLVGDALFRLAAMAYTAIG
ncbi:MAG: YggT family protein [Leptolyngbyaceae cyanobacterium MO_188.B28]|nr:YggT family protein [Leptolyngbyaceae cyanobacterium MO_188.B28]